MALVSSNWFLTLMGPDIAEILLHIVQTGVKKRSAIARPLLLAGATESVGLLLVTRSARLDNAALLRATVGQRKITVKTLAASISTASVTPTQPLPGLQL